MSFSIRDVVKRVRADTWERLGVEIPLDNEEVIRRQIGRWKTLHYDYFGKCFSLTLHEVSGGKNIPVDSFT